MECNILARAFISWDPFRQMVHQMSSVKTVANPSKIFPKFLPTRKTMSVTHTA